jgi:ferredoxin
MMLWRRISQVFFLLFFFYLVINTQWKFEGQFYRVRSPLPANLFFISDPLVLLSVSAATKHIVAVNFLPIIAMLGLTLVFGRFFCGWVCPLGTLIDASAHVIKRSSKASVNLGRLLNHRFKYYVLAGAMLLALVGVNVFGFLDPITVVTRATVLAALPYAEYLIRGGFDPLYAVPAVNDVSEPVYGFLKQYVFSQAQHYYTFGVWFLLMLVAVSALTRIQKRYWCTTICPLGAFYGLIGQIGLVHRRVEATCTECGLCETRCRMQAIRKPAKIFDHRECIQCMECRDICPVEAIHFTARRRRGVAQQTSIDLSRRGFLKTVGVSLLVLPLFRLDRSILHRDEYLLRPPGAVNEDEFLRRCVRCGECMRVCVKNALHPTMLQAGFEGMWTPVLIPRIGYCEYNCTLCGSVCPSEALRELTQPSKRKWRIGTAYFNKDRCLPWNELINCSVCEEACPVSPKAIVLDTVTVKSDKGEMAEVKQPRLIEERCIGCGICEYVCPLEGEAAIRVTSRYETRAQSRG